MADISNDVQEELDRRGWRMYSTEIAEDDEGMYTLDVLVVEDASTAEHVHTSFSGCPEDVLEEAIGKSEEGDGE